VLKESSLSSPDFTGVYPVTATLHNRQTYKVNMCNTIWEFVLCLNPHKLASYRKQMEYTSIVKFRNAEKTQISTQSAYSFVLIQFCPARMFLNATKAQHRKEN